MSQLTATQIAAAKALRASLITKEGKRNGKAAAPRIKFHVGSNRPIRFIALYRELFDLSPGCSDTDIYNAIEYAAFIAKGVAPDVALALRSQVLDAVKKETVEKEA